MLAAFWRFRLRFSASVAAAVTDETKSRQAMADFMFRVVYE